ncbi:LuxR C-terminal-related transcriptional regulator [Mycobacterium sp. ITM-2016-00318]|uniref:LuxR C-terminal-related transcriptional regulator n=1 Tax=Mycobacterium sp. ITM-2016-00318 TaxID=2099693 RepID=UPI000CF9F6E0|nr:LuxR family transcriptional regulator [Mycobacterium sp. ITM-2016-00318]WNG91819.1 LuxR C-terminal-related transcriptional regulator [Mycobacterium sp. ITM-2016-00318]
MTGDLLTGRDSELGTIRRALSGAGNHCGVVIYGAAGVGKTRLAREVLTRAQAAGERTNWITGTESARPLPLGAFTGSIIEAASHSMPDIGRLINSFVAHQRQGKVLIGVDDAHLLDGLSAHVVHQLAQTRGPRLIVTVRTGEAEPDAVTALWKDGLLARLDLAPLSETGTRSLIETTLDGPVDARSAQRFRKLTGGNALFLRQLLSDQVAAGRMRQVAGVWMWDERVAVSQNITDMVGRQLGELSDGVALVVDTLSQCEPLAVDVLSTVAERTDLETAEQMRLVNVERSGNELMARLAHPLYGELRRAGAGEMYLSRIRGKLAAGLSEKPDADMQSTVRRALLTLESDLPPDPDLFVDAARFAMTLLDLDLAERFASAAVSAGATEAPGVQAMNLVLRGRGDDAEKFLKEITAEGKEDAHRWSTVRAANLIWTLGRPADAAAILEGLTADAETPTEQASRIAVEACVDAVYGQCERAAEKATAALESQQLGDFHAMMASFALAMALGALGRGDELTAVADRALERASTSFQTAHLRFWFGGVYARACRLTGRIDDCAKLAKQMADSVNDVPGLAYANLVFLLGQSDLMRGNLAGAVKLLHEALAGVEHHGITTGLRPATCFALTEAHAKLGQSAEANAALEEARANVPDTYVYMHTALAVATGWSLAAGGYLSDAVTTVLDAAAKARERGQPTHELVCVQVAAQWGDASTVDRARELAGELSLPLADAVARHVEALAARDGEGLLAASNEYQALGDKAAAADAAAQAAVAFSHSQLRRRRLYAAAIAQGLSDECGGLSTPALRSPTGHPLTERQREIVELAVAGLSNKDIAKRLIMSVRSVEGHLYRACQRVGANSREELAAIIRRGPAATD